MTLTRNLFTTQITHTGRGKTNKVVTIAGRLVTSCTRSGNAFVYRSNVGESITVDACADKIEAALTTLAR